MPTEVDVLNAQNAVLLQISEKLDRVLTRLDAPVQGPVQPTPPSASDPTEEQKKQVAIAAFRAAYTKDDPAVFQSRYGVAWSQPLSPLPLPLTFEAVQGYAKNGYNHLGQYRGGPTCTVAEGTPEQVAVVALEANAKGDKASYYTGLGLIDADIATIAALGGYIDSEGLAAQLETGGMRRPKAFLLWDLPRFLNYLSTQGTAGGPA